jgi:hypothetical protein
MPALGRAHAGEDRGGPGHLAGCDQRALTAADADTVTSSHSTLPNYSRTYYARLRRELQQAMGLAVSPLFDED